MCHDRSDGVFRLASSDFLDRTTIDFYSSDSKRFVYVVSFSNF